MSVAFLDKARQYVGQHQGARLAVVVAWIAGGYILAQILVSFLFVALYSAGVNVDSINKVMLTFIASLCMYALALAIVVGIPARLFHWSARELRHRVGIKTAPHIMHVVMAVLGFIAYAAISYGLLWVTTQFFPSFNPGQEQSLGFHSFRSWGEVGIGFLVFVILAPFAEELFFRGFLFGSLRKSLSFVPAALITSILFGAAHGQLNVGLDTFALSLVLCFLYEGTGSIWSSIGLHMTKNAIAFSFLLSASSLQ